MAVFSSIPKTLTQFSKNFFIVYLLYKAYIALSFILIFPQVKQQKILSCMKVFSLSSKYYILPDFFVNLLCAVFKKFFIFFFSCHITLTKF